MTVLEKKVSDLDEAIRALTMGLNTLLNLMGLMSRQVSETQRDISEIKDILKAGDEESPLVTALKALIASVERANDGIVENADGIDRIEVLLLGAGVGLPT